MKLVSHEDVDGKRHECHVVAERMLTEDGEDRGPRGVADDARGPAREREQPP